MEASSGCVGDNGVEKAEAMISKRDTGYITTKPEESDPYCNLCSTKDPEPIEVYSLGFYTRHEQNVVTLLLCQTHRIDLMQTLARTLEIRVSLTATLNNPSLACCKGTVLHGCAKSCECDGCRGQEGE